MEYAIYGYFHWCAWDARTEQPCSDWRHEARDLSLHQGIQTDSVAHTASKQMQTGNYFPVGKVAEAWR
jgi:hypothetical protein